MLVGQTVSVRKLPDGAPNGGRGVAADGRRITMEIPNASKDLVANTAVEVVSEKTICLGTVAGREGDRVEVEVEHFLDRGVLAELQTAWNESERNNR